MSKENSETSPAKQAKACVLTINGGSSSIKIALFEASDPLRRILEGSIERIGLPEATVVVKGLNKTDNFTRSVTAANHTEAIGVLKRIKMHKRIPKNEMDDMPNTTFRFI